jgi:hypothetical protein
MRRIAREQKDTREGYRNEIRRIAREQKESREGYRNEMRRIAREQKESREGYRNEMRRIAREQWKRWRTSLPPSLSPLPPSFTGQSRKIQQEWRRK